MRVRLGDAAFPRNVSAGHAPRPAQAVAEALATGELPRYWPLSAREWEVARLVARGLTNREIADELVLTEGTVGAHLERLFAKLRLQSRAQLATLAVGKESGIGMKVDEPRRVNGGARRIEQPPARQRRLVGS